jgi:hypothetical protein
MRPRITTAATIALTITVSVGVAAATAVIFSSNFSSRTEFKAVQKLDGGEACRKFWRGKKSFGIEVKEGPLQCDFRTPVSGDSQEPDHEIEGTATVLKSTAKGVKKSTYVGVGLRADRSSRYELRVFPDTREWELRREPDRQGFPIQGTSGDITRIGKSNKLKLRVFGDEITAFVNNTKVVPEFTDPNPGELNGRQTMILAGHGNNSGKSAEAFFRNVRIRIP